MFHRSGSRRRIHANSRAEQPPRAVRRNALRGGASSERFLTILKVFRLELFFICALHWDHAELGKYVKYFYSKLFSVSQLAGFNLGDVQAHLQLAQWVEQHGVPDADEDIEELFDGFFNKVDLKVHSHKYRQGGWPKADIWCHMKFLDNMQTMASNIHATTVVINLNVMPVSLYVTVDPNDPNENYHYTLSVNDVRSETSNHGALFITVNCTTGTRKQIFEDGDMGPAEECAIDPLEVTISVVWKGPSDDFRKRC